MIDEAVPERIRIVPNSAEADRNRDHDVVVVDADICRAARGLANWTATKLAREAGISVADVGSVETNRSPNRFDARSRIRNAFEQAGIVFVPASKGGPGILRPAVR